MAMDGIRNAISKGIRVLRGEESAYEQTRRDQVTLANNRSRAAAMKAKLERIDFSVSKFKPGEIKEYQALANEAIRELNDPAVITMDTEALDKYIDYAIDAFMKAIQEGLEMTAQWSAAAIYQGLTNLRKEISGIDLENADALYQKRLEYAENLEILIKSSMQYDADYTQMLNQQVRYQEKLEEIQKKKEWYTAEKNTPEGSLAIAEIRQFASEPSRLSDKARLIQDELYKCHILEGSADEIRLDIHTKEKKLEMEMQEIESTRNRLAELPIAIDPMLHEKIDRATQSYRDNLRRTLNNLQEAQMAYERHLSALRTLAEHPTFTNSTATAIKAMNSIDREQREVLQRNLRLEKQKRMDAQRAEWNELHFNDAAQEDQTLQEERTAIHDVETQENSEAEVNVEYIPE